MARSVIQEDIKKISQAIQEETKKLEGRTLLISGGSGFIGSYLVATIYWLNKNYLKKACRVISIDNYITGSKRNIFNERENHHFLFLEKDVTKPFRVRNKVDYIIHAAGLASPIYYRRYPLQTIESAISGVKNLLNLAKRKKSKSLLYFSSSEIYGNPDPNFIPTPETYRGNVSCTGPRACYDESKRLGETICMVYRRLYKIPVRIVRPFNIYGPGMRLDDYRVIPTFLVNALKGEPLPVHGEGNQTRTFCYISDAVVGFFKVLLSGKEGEAYNVGNDNDEINMMSLAKTIVELFNNQVEIKTIPYPRKYPKGDPERRCPDLTKIRQNLSYQSLTSLKKGLRRTLQWYRQELGL